MDPVLAGLFVVVWCLVVAFLILSHKLRVLQHRYEQFCQEAAQMLAMQQNTVAAHDARLIALGSRSGGPPVPTAEEMADGRWRR